MVIEAACGRIPVFVDTGLNLVHVDDVAAGHRFNSESQRFLGFKLCENSSQLL
jgi:hypothetical protein